MDDTFTAGLSDDPLMQKLGFVRAVEYDPDAGRLGVEYEAKPDQCHSGNVVQGGFVTGWIDNVMALASMSKSGFELVAMSLDIHVQFYRPANPGIVVATGWVQRMGKRNAFTEGLLATPEGDPIAKAMATMAMIPRR